MKKLTLIALAVMTMGLIACGQSTNSGPANGEGVAPTVPASTGPAKTKAEVQTELAAFLAACKTDSSLAGCRTGEGAGTKAPVVGTNKTKAEVSTELAAFLTACKSAPKSEGCPGTLGPQ